MDAKGELTMKMTCEYCGREFEAKRKSARFCSDSHRTQNAYAKKHGTPKPIAWSSYTFGKTYNGALNVLRNLSEETADNLDAYVAKFGYKAGEEALLSLIIPLYEVWREAYNDLTRSHSERNSPEVGGKTWVWHEIGYEERRYIAEVVMFGSYHDPVPPETYEPDWYKEFRRDRITPLERLVEQGIFLFNSITRVYKFAPGVSAQSFTPDPERVAPPLA